MKELQARTHCLEQHHTSHTERLELIHKKVMSEMPEERAAVEGASIISQDEASRLNAAETMKIVEAELCLHRIAEAEAQIESLKGDLQTARTRSPGGGNAVMAEPGFQ